MSSLLLPLPSDCGERTLPALIDVIARTDGQRSIVSIPSAVSNEKYVDITFKAFAKAVNHCAWWIDENIKTLDTAQTIFYFGPLDIRYLIIMLAACKTGRVAFFSSHRNSMEAHLSLLEAANCGIVLVPDKAPAVLRQILSKRHMETLDFPSLDTFLHADPNTREYLYQPNFREVKDNTLVILHTSGSTGIPVPVHVTHGTFASNDAHQLIPSLGGRPTVFDYFRGRRIFVSLPLFHAACIGMWASGVFSGFTTVMPPAVPMTADVVDTIITKLDISASLMPPSLMVDIYNNPKYLENMINRLECVSYVGGALAPEVGDYLSKNLKLITLFGTTENMYYPLEIHDRPIDWSYVKFSPQLGHVYQEWKDNLSELVIIRDESKHKIQGVFSTFPKMNEYHTKDLYQRHLIRRDLWKFAGRADDIICFSNAEKLNPITMESVIMTHPEVSCAVIGGSGQFQASLLIEPKTHPRTEEEAQQLIERIWPTIAKANQECPAHGRLVRNFVMFTDPERPLPKAGKTTVQRFAAMEMYREEFKNIYANKQRSVLVHEKRPSSRPTMKDPLKIRSEEPLKETNVSPVHRPDLGPLSQQIQNRLQGMIEDILPELFGSIVTEVSRNLLRSGTKSTINTDAPLHKDPFQHTSPSQITPSKRPEPEICTEDHTTSDDETPPITTPQSIDEIKVILRNALAKTTDLRDINDDSDLFDHGLDSIQIVGFIEEVNKGLNGTQTGVERMVVVQEVHRNPTVSRLAVALGAAGA